MVTTKVDNLDQLESTATLLQLEAEVPKVMKRAHNRRMNPHHDHVPSDEMDLLIEIINESDLGWKADTCKLQKHHEKYGAHCDKDGPLMLSQKEEEQKGEAKANATADGGNKTDEGPKKFGEGPEFAKALATAQSWQKKYGSASEIPDAELPEQFDWRDIEGYDFTGKHRDQGACGSCHAVAFTQAAEQRLMVKYGKQVPQLAPQFLLDCNYLTEGCEGGWPHFHAYFAENGHLVSEDCAPYRSSTAATACS